MSTRWGAWLVAFVVVAGGCGDDGGRASAPEDLAIPDAPDSCGSVAEFTDRMGNLGITYDYNPSADPVALATATDAIVAGRLGWVRREGTDGQDRLVFTLAVDRVVDDPESRIDRDMIEFWVGWNPAALDFDDVADVTAPGTHAVVFLHAEAGGWVPHLEGFWVACDELDVARAALLDPSWGPVGTLDELIAAARPG